MKRLITRLIAGFAMLLIANIGHADKVSTPLKVAFRTAQKQDLGLLKTKVTDFLHAYTLSYPGEVSVSVGAIDPHLKLADCLDAQVFLPSGSRAWGKTTVGVRCAVPSAWTIYVQATLTVQGQYLVAAAPLAQGQLLTVNDIVLEKGDLTQLPAGVFTNPAQAIGRLVSVSMNAGTVLRQDMFKIAVAVQQGQTVKLVSSGDGFSVSAEGQAVTKANEGEIVRVKVASGQVVTGIARNGGQVEVGH